MIQMSLPVHYHNNITFTKIVHYNFKDDDIFVFKTFHNDFTFFMFYFYIYVQSFEIRGFLHIFYIYVVN